MVELPIVKKLKKEAHRKVAFAQDMIVKETYDFFGSAVLHGGTAIWRCYGGGRFSEDVDFYIPLKFRKTEKIRDFAKSLESKGFHVMKFREKHNSIYAKMKFGGAAVSFEAVFADRKGMLKAFEFLEGNFMNVYTLSPEQLIKEKTDAYLSRLKIRDIYDIFFLLNFVTDNKDAKISVDRLLKNFKAPADAQDLGAIIITGPVPTTEKILEAVRRWGKQST